MNLFPDHIFVWNYFQKEELINFHNNSSSSVHQVGASLYEYIFDKRRLKSKTNFCKTHGMDPRKNSFVLWVISTDS